MSIKSSTITTYHNRDNPPHPDRLGLGLLTGGNYPGGIVTEPGSRTTINAFKQPALDLSKTPNRLKPLLTQFSDVFTGIGKLKNDQVKDSVKAASLKN